MTTRGVYDPTSCELCGAEAADVLLDRLALRAMKSDARIVPRPLRKLRCRTCGLVRDGLGIAAGAARRSVALIDHAPESRSMSQRAKADLLVASAGGVITRPSAAYTMA